MKRLLQKGKYLLIETKKFTKILILEGIGAFAWVHARNIGEILVKTKYLFNFNNFLATGKYEIYNVKKEPNLVDLEHLELEVGKNKWQGYLLPKGLPTFRQKRHRIIPTYELVKEV